MEVWSICQQHASHPFKVLMDLEKNEKTCKLPRIAYPHFIKQGLLRPVHSVKSKVSKFGKFETLKTVCIPSSLAPEVSPLNSASRFVNEPLPLC